MLQYIVVVKLCHPMNLASLKGSIQNYFSLSVRKVLIKTGGVHRIPFFFSLLLLLFVCLFFFFTKVTKKKTLRMLKRIYCYKSSTQYFQIFSECCPTPFGSSTISSTGRLRKLRPPQATHFHFFYYNTRFR